MRAPSTALLLALASFCSNISLCAAQQEPINAKDKYKAACPAYDQYARFSQYVVFRQ